MLHGYSMPETVTSGAILPTRPCRTQAQEDPYTFRIILTQGLNRQIRRMCEALGYRVVSLRRVRVCNILLGNQPLGTWRKITGEELLYQAVSRNLLAGKTLICGCMLIDQDGVIYLQGMHSEDIGVEFCIDPNDRQAGYQLMTTDGSCSFNLWRFENKLMISPSLITYWDGLPS